MDLNDPRVREVFFDLHSDLPREGPGNRDCTARALALAGALPRAPQVLDIACGPGMQTMDLAELLPDATIIAIDSHEPFVAEVNRRAAANGIAHRVTAMPGDMTSLNVPPGRFDLIWCEGAAYIMGVGTALRAWKPLLRPGGKLALSEAIWLRADPPDEVRRCWNDYPEMCDIATCRRLVRDSGFHLLGDFVLPEKAWWEHYYRPLEQRLKRIAPGYTGDPVAEAVLRVHAEEIATYRAHAAYYGYVFLVMSVTAAL